jgi:hypothetical protein
MRGKTEKEKRDRLELAGRRVIETLDDMASIFLPKDSLLKMAGIVPVYYWFIKSLEPDQFYVVREFLVNTEEKRKSVQKMVTENAENVSIDQELIQFNAFYRSPNDAASIEGRYRILKKRFTKFAR